MGIVETAMTIAQSAKLTDSTTKIFVLDATNHQDLVDQFVNYIYEIEKDPGLEYSVFLTGTLRSAKNL